MKDMKNFLEINRALVAKKRIIMIIMAAALVALPTMAQQQEWKSTSPMMQNGGSVYSSHVTPVGSAAVPAMATTTESYSPSKAPASGGPHKSIEYNQEFEDNDEGSPVGSPVLPLMVMAVLFAGVVYMRRKRLTAKS